MQAETLNIPRRPLRPLLQRILLQQPLTKRTPLPNPRPRIKQRKGNRNTRQTSKPQDRGSPPNTQSRIQRIRSKREQRTHYTPHDNRCGESAR